MNTGRPFLKMHGLGNDFVVLDARAQPLTLDPGAIRRLSDRHTGIGCDQLIVVEAARSPLSDVWMSIYNADGSEVSACGNASRCVAWLLMKESGRPAAVIETRAGLLDAESRGDSLVAVDMGPARLDWREIPVAEAVDTLHMGLTVGPLADPVGVSMGNPHAVFFVDDTEAVDLAAWGPVLENHPFFPERANIEVAEVLSRERIRMRVWERGSGITRACGTGACATLVAAARRGLTGRRAEVLLDGGTLSIEWQGDDHVLMTGPVAQSFSGIVSPSLLA
ncbi:MAG: diaminopimelate epimerase [Magnetospirillum sp.]|nr:diaminopimelate epimerase [Magnetospirillum sp.]